MHNHHSRQFGLPQRGMPGKRGQRPFRAPYTYHDSYPYNTTCRYIYIYISLSKPLHYYYTIRYYLGSYTKSTKFSPFSPFLFLSSLRHRVILSACAPVWYRRSTPQPATRTHAGPDVSPLPLSVDTAQVYPYPYPYTHTHTHTIYSSTSYLCMGRTGRRLTAWRTAPSRLAFTGPPFFSIIQSC